MKILGIETSCDETGVAIIEGDTPNSFVVLGHALYSQASLHSQYGGVFPSLAKREHSKNLIPLLKEALIQAKLLTFNTNTDNKIYSSILESLRANLKQEVDLMDQIEKFIPTIEKPSIDAIAVTVGPGLEPALWVGINLAKALSALWGIPIMPINHMEGHILSALIHRGNVATSDSQSTDSNTLRYTIHDLSFPTIAVLVSGAHTELVLIEKLFYYKILGRTKDDAIGEAYDKVARMMGLPYPGGPEIARLAQIGRQNKQTLTLFPRPMQNSNDLNFSFSGLKTAVLYHLKEHPINSSTDKEIISAEFEESIADTIVKKTERAINDTGSENLIFSGGVSANTYIRERLGEMAKSNGVKLLLPPQTTDITGDNALMIAIAGLLRCLYSTPTNLDLKAQGNLNLKDI